jgi:membrane associated rhomboid family serine protease
MSAGGMGFTPLSKSVLIGLLSLYVVQQIAERWLGLPVFQMLAWWPFGSGFKPWQPFTAFLLNGDVMRAFFDWLFLFFLLPSIEQIYSKERLLRGAIGTVLGSVIIGFVLVLVGAVSVKGPWYGIEPLLAALLVVFGLSRPNAQILLFFVLPIKAAWVAWGSGLLCLLYLLSGRDISSAMWAGGWISGYFWVQGGIPINWKKPFLKWKHQRIKKRLSRFDVIDGGKAETPRTGWQAPGSDDNVH